MADQLRQLTDAHTDLYKEIEAHVQQAYDLTVKVEALVARYQSGAIIAPVDIANQTIGMYMAIAGELMKPVHEIPPIYARAAFALAYNEAHGKNQERSLVRKASD